jgi:hypothetical protein
VGIPITANIDAQHRSNSDIFLQESTGKLELGFEHTNLSKVAEVSGAPMGFSGSVTRGRADMGNRRFIGFALVLFAALVPQHAAAQQKLTISTIEGGSIFVQVGKAVMTKVYKDAGLEILFVDLPGKRAVVNANKGVTDGEMFRSTRAAKLYKNLIRLEPAAVTDEFAVYSVNVGGPINSVKELGQYSVAYRRGSTIPTKVTAGMRRFELDSFEQGVKLLQSNRIDVMLYFKIPTTFNLQHSFPGTKIRRISEKLIVVPLYHYLHKRNKHLVPRLEAALRRILDSGERDRIVEAVVANGGFDGDLAKLNLP